MINTNPAFIRAARGLLGWNLQDLSVHCGISVGSLQRIEAGKQNPEIDSLRAIYDAFLRSGVKITNNGVELVAHAVTTLTDFSDVLKDALACLAPGEPLWLDCADERRNSPEVTALFKEIEGKGVALRYLCERGNHHFTTSAQNYRWVDPEIFASAPVRTVYADKVVEHLPGNNSDLFIMITCAELAQARARQIEATWDRGEKPCLPEAEKDTGRK